MHPLRQEESASVQREQEEQQQQQQPQQPQPQQGEGDENNVLQLDSVLDAGALTRVC